MKGLRFLLVGLIFMLVLVACGGGETAEEPAAQTEATTAPVAATEAPTLPPPVIDADGDSGSQTEGEGETAAPAEEAQDAPSPTPDPLATGPWPQDAFGYGVQIHGNATVGDPAHTMDTVKNQLGLNWVKMQLQWWVVHPEPDVDQWFFYDAVIDEAEKRNLRVLVSVVGAPEWTRAANNHIGPPDDYSEFAAFLSEMINRYRGKIDAIEVWNEQNLDREWQTANGINPEDYVEFLQVAHETIKAEDPDIIVISGALSPTGEGDWVRWADDFAYLDRALAAGMLDYADCVGAHHNGYNIGRMWAFRKRRERPKRKRPFSVAPLTIPTIAGVSKPPSTHTRKKSRRWIPT